MNELFIYHCSQDVVTGSDIYSDIVVIAESMEKARKMRPREYMSLWTDEDVVCSGWARWQDVKVTLIGKALETETVRVVCTSYHAG